MAEEKQEGQEELSQTEQASDTGTGEATEAKTVEAQVDYEAEYKKLQSEHTQLSQKSAENEQLIQTMEPFVDWDKARGREVAAEPDEGEEEFVSRKEVNARLDKMERTHQIERMTASFLGENPDLKPYEKLVGSYLLNETNPRKPIEQRLKDAGKLVGDFLKTEREKGASTAQAEADKKKVEAASASGLSSTGVTTPQKPKVDTGETNDEYMARRKEQSRKSRGLT